MELQQFRYVLAVAETRNFTRAAEQCFVVQSALSHQIKSLEQELGVALFARTSRRVALTEAGAAFLPAARACLDAADRASADAAAATGQVRGQLRIGMIPTVTAIDLPEVLGRLHRLHPAVRTVLSGAPSDELVAAVAAGSLDLAVLGLPDGPPPERVRTRVLARSRHVAVVGANHPLARRRRIRLQDMAEEPYADFPAGTPGRVQSDVAFEAAGLTRNVAFEAMAPEMILGLVEQGLAVALLPAGYVASRRDLTAIAVADGPSRVEYLAWSTFNPSPATAAFLDVVDELGEPPIGAARLGGNSGPAGRG